MRAEESGNLLSGLTVAEWGRGTGVRYCGKLLASLGAGVVRLGPGDDGRQANSHRDVLLQHGAPKESFGGARATDVLVTDGTRPDLEEQQLAEGSVVVALTPFGREGARRTWVASDLQVQAMGGLCALIGEPDRHPLYIPYDFAQLQQGIHGASAAVAAVLSNAGHTPRQIIDIAATDVIASYCRMYSMLYRQYGIRPHRAGRRAPGSGGRYPFGIFPCRDGYVVLIGRYKDDWNRYLEMMGSPAWGAEFSTIDEFELATHYADQVDAHVIPWLMQHTRDEIAGLGRRYNLPVAPVRTVDEVLMDEQLAFRGFFHIEQGLKVPGLPATFRGSPVRVPGEPQGATADAEGP